MALLPSIGFDLSGIAGHITTRAWMLQRTYNWQLFMPHSLKGVMGIFVSQYCQSIRFGDYSITDISKMRYGPYNRFYASLQEIGSIFATFLVPVDRSVYDYFYNWHELIVDKNGYYSPKNRYAKTIYVSLYDRSGVESTKFILKGVFPRNKPSVDAAYASEEVLVLPVEFSVDKIEVEGLIGSIRSGVEKFAGSVAEKTKNLFGKIGAKGTTEWAGTNTGAGFQTPTPSGTFYA